MTLYSLLRALAGLSLREASDFHRVRLDTAKSWSAGRNPPPPKVLSEVRALIATQERAAAEALATIAEKAPAEIELGLAADDHEARTLGWPCVGAQAAMLARVLAGLPESISVRIVPRGPTVATAADADAHGLYPAVGNSGLAAPRHGK